MKNYMMLSLLLLAFASNAQQNDFKESQNTDKNWFKNELKNTVFSLGVNNLANTDNNTNIPNLRPLASRYFSIAREKSFILSKSKNAGLYLKTGVGVSWNNFMFDNNQTIVSTQNGVEFKESPVSLEKSKLTASYLNIPLALDLKFKNSFISHISAGGYVGLNIGSHSKIKTVENQKTKTNDNYFVNKTRYGISAELGFRNSVDLFAHYDLNTVFQNSKGPQANVMSVGIRF